MSANPGRPALRLIIDHLLLLGYPCSHVKTAAWVRNYDLHLDPEDVERIFREAIRDAIASGEWQAAFRRRCRARWAAR